MNTGPAQAWNSKELVEIVAPESNTQGVAERLLPA